MRSFVIVIWMMISFLSPVLKHDLIQKIVFHVFLHLLLFDLVFQFPYLLHISLLIFGCLLVMSPDLHDLFHQVIFFLPQVYLHLPRSFPHLRIYPISHWLRHILLPPRFSVPFEEFFPMLMELPVPLPIGSVHHPIWLASIFLP